MLVLYLLQRDEGWRLRLVDLGAHLGGEDLGAAVESRVRCSGGTGCRHLCSSQAPAAAGATASKGLSTAIAKDQTLSCPHLAKLDAPLVKAVDVPDKALQGVPRGEGRAQVGFFNTWISNHVHSINCQRLLPLVTAYHLFYHIWC